MDFYNLFDMIAQFNMAMPMVMPFFDATYIKNSMQDQEKLFYEQTKKMSNLYNMYKYNLYYITNNSFEHLAADPQTRLAQSTNDVFYSLISEKLVQNQKGGTSLSFNEYVKSISKINKQTQSYNITDNNLDSSYLASFGKSAKSLQESSFKNDDVDKIIKDIETRLSVELEASPYGVYS